ncbi:MAG TPA: hypothetical protein DGG95_06155, partial [Cytophagales bacterium]|nr:hypothetical protein [Cytophagales bacterium]
MRRILNFLLTIVSAQSFGQLGFSLADGATKVQIPIEIHNNLVVVPVIINNQLPLKFIVDTGVRTTILTEKTYSDILHLAYSKKYTISAPGGEKLVNAYITNNVTLDMPGVHGRGHAMLVLETDYLELRSSLGTAVHGILGYELFSRFVVEIDYENKLLKLMTPQKFKPKKKYASLPITVEDTKPYYVADVWINDTTSISAKLMVDTGASHGLFLDTKSNHKIIVPTKNISCSVGRGLAGVITGKIGRIKSLAMGKYKIPDMIASFPDRETYNDSLQGTKVYRNGSIGGDVLSRFDVIFDFPSEKIYIKPNSTLKKKSFNNMSGLVVKAIGLKLREFEIIEVRVNSPAFRSAIQKGDKIVSINTLPTSDMDLSHVNNFFNTRPGKKVKMQLLRANQIIE